MFRKGLFFGDNIWTAFDLWKAIWRSPSVSSTGIVESDYTCIRPPRRYRLIVKYPSTGLRVWVVGAIDRHLGSEASIVDTELISIRGDGGWGTCPSSHGHCVTIFQTHCSLEVQLFSFSSITYTHSVVILIQKMKNCFGSRSKVRAPDFDVWNCSFQTMTE
jgi:hypothetical protein